jgi:hypothetical protein
MSLAYDYVYLIYEDSVLGYYDDEKWADDYTIFFTDWERDLIVLNTINAKFLVLNELFMMFTN